MDRHRDTGDKKERQATEATNIQKEREREKATARAAEREEALRLQKKTERETEDKRLQNKLENKTFLENKKGKDKENIENRIQTLVRIYSIYICTY